MIFKKIGYVMITSTAIIIGALTLMYLCICVSFYGVNGRNSDLSYYCIPLPIRGWELGPS